MVMQIQKNVTLAPYTSLHAGGTAETLVLCSTVEEFIAVLNEHTNEEIYILGFGTNSLISDAGLSGVTVIYRGGNISQEDDTVIADAGVWWDDLVNFAIEKQLWGIELTAGIPSSVGGAIVGNIAAYGQQVSDTLTWIDVLDTNTGEQRKINAAEIDFEYRKSSLQQNPSIVILRAAFVLSDKSTTELSYASATSVANERKLDSTVLQDRQKIILEARRRAGSLYNPDNPESYTAGSFFKNPLVSEGQARRVAAFDESGKSLHHLMNQNKVHGGDTKRVSAAHVLLAAGFRRGQTWGNVRLHPDHILKIENTGNASAQEIYDVAQLIIKQVKEDLGIVLVPEVKFIGDFSS